MIVIRDLCKQFSAATVLKDINLQVEPGEFVALLGPSGCGKSTLLRVIAGLEEPSSGQCGWRGDASRPRTAFVFQEPNLLPWQRVSRNIALPLELERQLTSAEIRTRVNESLARVGLLSEDARKLPKQLSGGMKMRVSLARALVTHPQLMLMDEPFAALDDMLRQQLNEDVVSLWMSQHWTTLFVTHNVAEAVFLSQRVLIMGRHPGRILTEISIPFDYPRRWELRATAEFAEMTGRVGQALRETLRETLS